MPGVHAICCGIDVHQACLTARLRQIDATGQVTQDVRACATTDGAWWALLDELVEAHGPVVALEGTGVSRKPVDHVPQARWRSLWAMRRRGLDGRGRSPYLEQFAHQCTAASNP